MVLESIASFRILINFKHADHINTKASMFDILAAYIGVVRVLPIETGDAVIFFDMPPVHLWLPLQRQESLLFLRLSGRKRSLSRDS